MSLRPVKQILETKSTIEGAGVKLERAFGFGKTKRRRSTMSRITRSCYSTAAMKSQFRRDPKESAFCWYRASRSKNP